MIRCCGKGEEKGKACASCICVLKQLLLCTEALLSRKGLTGSSEQIPLTGLLCIVLLSLSNCHYQDPQAFQPYSYFYPILCEKGKSEWLCQCLEVGQDQSSPRYVLSFGDTASKSLCARLTLRRDTKLLDLLCSLFSGP